MQNVLQFPVQMPSTDPTVGEVINLYISLEVKVEARMRAKRSWEERVRRLRRFAGTFGALHISECSKGHLKVWIEENPRWRSNWTRGGVCRTVQRVFNWAVDDMELIVRNPFKGVHYPKGKRGRPLTDEEFEALVRLAGPIFEPVLRFCRLTGARPGEMSDVRWEQLQIDEAAGCAWIIQQDHKTSHIEDAKPRVIALPRAALDLLISIRQALGVLPGLEPDHIFLNKRRRPWTRNAISLRMRKLRNRANLPADAKLYGCRHAFATGAIENGVSLKDLAELLGHTSTRMTEHYVHIAGKHHRLSAMAEQAAGTPPPAPPRSGETRE